MEMEPAKATTSKTKQDLRLDAEKTRQILNRDGLCVLEDSLRADQLETIEREVVNFIDNGALIQVNRGLGAKKLHFRTFNGDEIKTHAPSVSELYYALLPLVREVFCQPLHTMDNLRIGMSVNVLSAGDKFALHYDRNEATVIFYLTNQSEGALTIYPRWRVLIWNRYRFPFSLLQVALDLRLKTSFLRRWINPRKVLPKRGRVLLMQGTKCLHGMEPFQGGDRRISIQLAYVRSNEGFSESETRSYYGMPSKPQQA